MIKLGLALIALAATSSSGQTDLFARDSQAPLNVRVIERMDSARFTREKIVFDGRRGVRVPGFIAMPKDGVQRHPIIILVDGLGGWKERWWSPTSWNRGKVLIDSLLAAGFAVAMADAPASGERTFENDFVTAESFVRDLPRWQEMGINNAIETRRLMDYVVARPDVDSARIGMLGLSHGGMMTFALTATDSRVKAAVAGLTPMQRIPEPLMPMTYANRIRVPMLLLAATKDAWYTRDQVERALGALRTADRKLVWYEGGHRVPEEYAEEATRWFARVIRR